MRVSQKIRRFFLISCGFFVLSSAFFAKYFSVKDLSSYFRSGYQLPLSIHCNKGRLGNQMCTYATLYGLSVLNNRTFVPLTCNNDHLSPIFVGPSKVEPVNEILFRKSNPWKLLSYFKPEDSAIPSNCTFMNGYYYPCSYTFFDHAKDGLRKEFQFQDFLNLHAQDVLHKANVQKIQDVIYVGIHVRRGDYQKAWLEAFEAAPVNMEYFQKAIQYFRDKYNNTIFVAVSEDRPWCKKHLTVNFGVYVPQEAPSAAHDLAVLANCNHTIMTYGTFGFWGAYLAGGEVVYFDNFLKPNTTFSKEEFLFEKMYPPYWKGIATINSSYWLEYENVKPLKVRLKNKRKMEYKNVKPLKVRLQNKRKIKLFRTS